MTAESWQCHRYVTVLAAVGGVAQPFLEHTQQYKYDAITKGETALTLLQFSVHMCNCVARICGSARNTLQKSMYVHRFDYYTNQSSKHCPMRCHPACMLMLMRCSTRSKCCAVRSEAPGLQCGCAWSKSRTRALKVRWVPLSGRYHAPVRHEAARLARQLASQQRGDNSGPPGGGDGKWYNRDACDTAPYSCRTPSHQFARPAVSWAVLAAPKRLRLASKRTTAHPSPFFPRRTCSRAPTHS